MRAAIGIQADKLSRLPLSHCFTLKKHIMQVPDFTTCYVRSQSAQAAGRVATGFPLPSTGRGTEGEGWSYPELPPVRFFLYQPHPGVPAEHLKLNTENFPQNLRNITFYHLETTTNAPQQATRHNRASHRWWTKSRCDSVCLRSRHFMAWLRRGLAHDAMAIQTTQLSQGFPKLNA